MRSIVLPLELTVRLVREGRVGCMALAWKLVQTFDDCMCSNRVCIAGC
jgi:hypothetical protein